MFLIMSVIQILMVVLFLLALTPVAYSQVSYYGVNNVIKLDGSVDVNITITFSEAVKSFDFFFFGKINNFKASSSAGPVECKVESRELSYVNCLLSLTQEKRNLDMSFTTGDLVKSLENKFFFNGDFGISKRIGSVFVSVKLPEGMILADDERYPIKPSGVQTISDGRSIIAVWGFSEVGEKDPLKFQLAYESTSPIAASSNYLLYFIVGAAVASSISFIVIRRFRKPKDVILSVLDKYERDVMDKIVKAGGTINQKKIVQQTNLSKAKVSRVIKNLVNRGLVESERRGRTSIIKLINKRFSHF